jgi:hypothetical protein
MYVGVEISRPYPGTLTTNHPFTRTTASTLLLLSNMEQKRAAHSGLQGMEMEVRVLQC